MPEIGEIKKGSEIGYKGGYKYIWSACIDCGKERWIRLIKGQPVNIYCQSCWQRGDKNPSWKGERLKDSSGYILVRLPFNDFFRSMANGRSYVLEHRLVMAKYLGRNLQSWELVHHKNHIRDDNRIENLQLVTDDRHTQITILENRISYLEQRVTLLEAENTLLRTTKEVRNG